MTRKPQELVLREDAAAGVRLLRRKGRLTVEQKDLNGRVISTEQFRSLGGALTTFNRMTGRRS